MHVVITLAGHSRRFHAAGYQGPKALLPVGGVPMIQRVVEMFGGDEDHFHFVVNEEQVRDEPSLREQLQALAARVSVVVVPAHERGPVYSALQVADIPDDAPVIITYCDFVVTWNYRQFLRHAAGHSGAIPSFRGFHPASFGTTFYAYMHVEGDRMLELREKASFTDDRTTEHASAGIYYFGSWTLFRRYGLRLLDRFAGGAHEAYVSLLFNDMLADGLDVIVHEVEHFICLGTPGDYEQHEFWWQYFHSDQTPWFGPPAGAVNLLPMAGAGSRFKQYGYRLAKPLIAVRGQPMAIRALQSMPPAGRWVFLLNGEELRKHPIEATLRKFAPEAAVIAVDRLTSGQAATCLLAEAELDPDAGVLIASCDYEHRFDGAAWQQILDDASIDGAVWTCRMRMLPMKAPTAFAWCRVGSDGRTITEVVEKRAISDRPGDDPLAIGTFWYRRAADFVRGARMMIERGITVNGEHYVGTSINGLIEEGRRFVIFEVTQWIPFGDPFELRILEYWDDYFHRPPGP